MLIDHASFELSYAKTDLITSKAVLDLVQCFADQGHSGSSAGFLLGMIKHTEIFPLTTLVLRTKMRLGPIPEEDGPDRWMRRNILELIEIIANLSDEVAAQAFEHFLLVGSWKPISPLTGEDREWKEIGDGRFQNRRCSRVFKDGDECYDIDGKVFVEKSGSCYTSYESRVPVTFPYTPKTEYVDV